MTEKAAYLRICSLWLG